MRERDAADERVENETTHFLTFGFCMILGVEGTGTVVIQVLLCVCERVWCLCEII
jgi:hypothetical protein